MFNQIIKSMQLFFKIFLSVSLLIVTLIDLSAQANIIINGKILDEKGAGLPGATIIVKGTNIGALGNIDGTFQLNNVRELPVTLIISSVGYTHQEVKVNKDETLTVTLSIDINKLDEVVIVGYGTQKRKELTGAISSVPKSALEHVTTSFDGMLGGTVAGVNVTQSSGQPGSASSIRIRGGNSVYASNEPLYVIDGFIFYQDGNTTKTGLGNIESSINPLASVNPSDIESVEVLKDVSATAIYGSRGANGVIIVTTKKGKRDKTTVNYTHSIGWNTAARRLDLINATQWAQLQKDYFNNKGNYTDEEIAQLGKGYDWQNKVLRTALSQNHELSISGGDDKTRFLLSGNYIDQDGIVINSGFKRYNARVNIDRDLYRHFTIGMNATFGKNVQNSLTTTEPVNYNSSPFSSGITNSLTYALFMPPVVPIYNNDGSYNYTNPYEYMHFALGSISANPVSDLNNSVAENINNSLLANFYARYTLTEGLEAKISAGIDQSSITQNFFAPSYTAIGLAEAGIGGIGNKRYETWQTEYTLGYTKRFNAAHFINLLGGYTSQNTQVNYVTSIATHFTNETLKQNNLADGSVTYPPVSGSSKSALNSVIARVNYILLEKYNLTATFRADNSTRFAKKHRWGYFPSIGLSWNVNEENFLSNQSILNVLKFRLTAGTVGNQEIGDYEYSQIYSARQYNGSAAYIKDNIGNRNLKWETTTQYNVGIDAGFFNDRLTLVADIYYKKTYDLLLNAPVPPWEGVTQQLENIGNVTNRGIELSINASLVKTKTLDWRISANFARNINKITDMGNTKALLFGNNLEQILQTGESLGSFYGLVFDGIVQTGEDLSSLPVVNGEAPAPGDIKFVDVSGPDGAPDGKIDLNDRVVLGSIQPDFTYGLSTTLAYHNFDLFVSFQGSQGNEVFNSLRRNLEHAGDSYNVSSALLDVWTTSNPSKVVPRITGVRPFAFIDSRYVEDASYFRLKNITLGYNIKIKTLLNIRLFVSSQNLFTISKYKGYDPEVSSGIDLGAYPTARTFSAGVGLTIN